MRKKYVRLENVVCGKVSLVISPFVLLLQRNIMEAVLQHGRSMCIFLILWIWN